MHDLEHVLPRRTVLPVDDDLGHLVPFPLAVGGAQVPPPPRLGNADQVGGNVDDGA
jgi:hypothetical protein